MKPTKFKTLKTQFNVKPWDINRTNINSPEDKYQDKVLESLEKKNQKVSKKPKKVTRLTYNEIIVFFENHRLPLTKNQKLLIANKVREELE